MLYYQANNCEHIHENLLLSQFKALHIGLMGGDLDECMRFALQKFRESGVDKLAFMIPSEREDLHEIAAKYGFTIPTNHIIMLERAF